MGILETTERELQLSGLCPRPCAMPPAWKRLLFLSASNKQIVIATEPTREQATGLSFCVAKLLATSGSFLRAGGASGIGAIGPLRSCLPRRLQRQRVLQRLHNARKL